MTKQGLFVLALMMASGCTTITFDEEVDAGVDAGEESESEAEAESDAGVPDQGTEPDLGVDASEGESES